MNVRSTIWRRVVLACGFLVCALAGLGVGYALSWHSAAMKYHVTNPEELLYGASSRAETIAKTVLSQEDVFQNAVHMMLTDYRGRPVISSNRKASLLFLLRQDQSMYELSRSLALGANQDKAPDVREECVAILRDWHDALSQASYMIDRHIELEKDDSIKHKKQAFVIQVQGTQDHGRAGQSQQE